MERACKPAPVTLQTSSFVRSSLPRSVTAYDIFVCGICRHPNRAIRLSRVDQERACPTRAASKSIAAAQPTIQIIRKRIISVNAIMYRTNEFDAKLFRRDEKKPC